MPGSSSGPYAPLDEDATSFTVGGPNADDESGLRKEVAELRVKLAQLEASETGHLVKAFENLVAAGQTAGREALSSVANGLGSCVAAACRAPTALCSSLLALSGRPVQAQEKQSSFRKKPNGAAGPDYAPAAAAAHKGPVMIAEDDWEQHQHRGLLFPSGPLKFKWDALIFALIIYSCVVVPWRIGMNHPPDGAWAIFEFGITLAFICDLVANFYTAYREGDQFVISKPMIRENYLKGWFLIDLPSSFPTELVGVMVGCSRRTASSTPPTACRTTARVRPPQDPSRLRLVRLLRLLRLLKVQEYIDKLEDELHVSLQSLQLVKVVFGLLYARVLGCSGSGPHRCHRMECHGSPRTTTRRASCGCVDPYLYSVYFTFTTLTTVGYGDVTPTNNDERLYALLCQLIGAFVFGYILSTVAELVSNVDPNAVRIEEKLSEVRVYLRWHRFPSDLSTRVKRYYEFYFSRKSAMDEEQILNCLAPALRREVLLHLLGKSVGRMPALAALTTDEQLEVQPMLKPLVREAKEMIFAKNTPGLTLYFLSKGRLCGRGDMGFEFFEVNAVGAAFGEHCLMGSKRAPYHAIAKTRCELFALSLKDLFRLTSRLQAAQLDHRARPLQRLYAAAATHDHGDAFQVQLGAGCRAAGQIEPTRDPAGGLQALRLQTRWRSGGPSRRLRARSRLTGCCRASTFGVHRTRRASYGGAGVRASASAADERCGAALSPRATTPRAAAMRGQGGAIATGAHTSRTLRTRQQQQRRRRRPRARHLPARRDRRLARTQCGGSGHRAQPWPGGGGGAERRRVLPPAAMAAAAAIAAASKDSVGAGVAAAGGGGAGAGAGAGVAPAPRVAYAILGPAGAAQIESILAEQLKVQGASLREMIREVVQSELDARGVTQLGVTAGQMLNA